MFVDAIRRRIRFVGNEQGSMVIALLAVIVTSGLMISITASVVAGHESAGFDRDHVRAVQGADAGVEEVIYKLTNPNPAQPFVVPTAMPSPLPVGDGLDGATYQYEVVEPVPRQGAAWQVNSTSRLRNQTRRVSAIVAQPTPFQLVAFADSHLVFRGGNTADSYNATQWDTNLGVVGSNGTIVLNGNADADGAALHNYGAAPDPTRCTSNGNTVCTGFKPVDEKTDVTSNEVVGFIDDALKTPSPAPGACGNTTTLTAFTGPTLAARPEPYCFTTMNLSANFNVTGAGNALVYLTGTPTATTTFGVSNKVRVNCDLCTGFGGAEKPNAARLQIFTKSVGPIRIGNHTHVAASIFAPNATCGGNYSNAGANFYGSLVCQVITNQGAWAFHYDDRLRDLGVGGWTVKRWAEQ